MPVGAASNALRVPHHVMHHLMAERSARTLAKQEASQPACRIRTTVIVLETLSPSVWSFDVSSVHVSRKNRKVQGNVYKSPVRTSPKKNKRKELAFDKASPT